MSWTGEVRVGRSICIVGAGPRGLSMLERLYANERHKPSAETLTVHIVDCHPPGAGAVWRTDQSRLLLMNTVAAQITVFTDFSSRISGPIEPGPTLYEWARELAERGSGDDGARAEARDLGPDSYPTRALYGRYLREMFCRVRDGAPAHCATVVHRSRAVALTGDDAQRVRLDDGAWLDGLDAVVLAQGHVGAEPTAEQRRTLSLARDHALRYVLPANPADVDLSGIEPGEPVLLRGLGLTFIDYLVLLTSGRGGTFQRAGAVLRYLPSGQEPRIAATSRRGVPYHARGENQKGLSRYVPRLFTNQVIDSLRERRRAGGRVRFAADVWPLIAREVESVYYTTLLREHGVRSADGFTDQYLSAPQDSIGALLNRWAVAPGDRWDWDRLAQPLAGARFTGRDQFRSWLLSYLDADVREARRGNVGSPVKAAVDVLRDLRNEIRLCVDHAGLDGWSHRDELDKWYTPLNAFLSIGPPASRIEQMRALIAAGVLQLAGPDARIRVDSAAPAFVAVSPSVPGPPMRARTLIEARLPEPDLRRASDPLLRYLLATAQVSRHRIPAEDGGAYETGGLAVTRRSGRLIDPAGRVHPRRYAYGVPTESVHWATAAGIRPGVDSVTLSDSDRIARAVLDLPPLPCPTTTAEPLTTGVPL